MKYYATVTRIEQFEIGGSKEQLMRDIKILKGAGQIDKNTIVRIYGVDLKTGNRVEVSEEDEAEIMKEADDV